uniref:Uncharacterized protein n=1 Tax=Vitis vinifera TaxID=29760 RepID=F6GXC0_VITVI
MVPLFGLLPNPKLETSALSISLICSVIYMIPLGFSGAISMVRGSGKQKIDALINLGAYYLVGIPSGALLAFVYHIGGNVKKATNRVHHDSIVPVNVASSSSH